MINAQSVKELREISGAGMMDCKKALTECNGDMDKAIDYLREKGIAKAAKRTSRIAAEGLANIFIRDNKAVVLEMNSETDFVSKNDEFKGMIDVIGNAILDSDITNIEDALNVNTSEGTVNDLIIAKTAKIGEKLSLRRISVVNKNDNEFFGNYLHMGGKIATLIVIDGGNEEIAKDVAMQAAAMKPLYVFKEDVPSDVLEREMNVLKEQVMGEGKPADIAEKMVLGRIGKFYKEVCLADQAFIKDSGLDITTYLKNNGATLKSMVRYEVGEGMEKRNDDFEAEVMKQVKGN